MYTFNSFTNIPRLNILAKKLNFIFKGIDPLPTYFNNIRFLQWSKEYHLTTKSGKDQMSQTEYCFGNQLWTPTRPSSS
jgi:hypothetical protein